MMVALYNLAQLLSADLVDDGQPRSLLLQTVLADVLVQGQIAKVSS